jgi:hypothetical protein
MALLLSAPLAWIAAAESKGPGVVAEVEDSLTAEKLNTLIARAFLGLSLEGGGSVADFASLGQFVIRPCVGKPGALTARILSQQSVDAPEVDFPECHASGRILVLQVDVNDSGICERFTVDFCLVKIMSLHARYVSQ